MLPEGSHVSQKINYLLLLSQSELLIPILSDVVTDDLGKTHLHYPALHLFLSFGEERVKQHFAPEHLMESCPENFDDNIES